MSDRVSNCLSSYIIQSDEDDEESAAIRREMLRKAVEGDDWSGVVDAQTKATISSTSAAASAPSTEAVVSPFDADSASSSSSSSQAVLPTGEEPLELTPANVDKVLDEVRPYLISDGGNIEVVRIDTEKRDVSSVVG